MQAVSAVWREVASFGGLVAVLFMMVHVLYLWWRGADLEGALAQTWLGRGSATSCVITALLGCGASLYLVQHTDVGWLAGLMFSLSAAALCALVFWLLTLGGRQLRWVLLFVFLLPAASGFVVSWQ